MAMVQTTFFFACNSYGWSETWFKNSEQSTLQAFYGTSALPLAIKRAAMLAAEARIVAVSCSFTDVEADSYLRYENLPGNPTQHCDIPNTTIYSIVRGANDTKRKAVFVRGQADDVTHNGGTFDPGAAVFVAAGTIFFDAIVQGTWGWMTAVPGPPGKVVGYVTDPDNYVELEFSAGFFPAPGLEIKYEQVRILFKGKKSVLNGMNTLEVLSTTAARTLKPRAVFPFDGKEGSAVLYGYAFQAASNWNFQKSGTRRAGRPKLVTPGRQLEAARG